MQARHRVALHIFRHVEAHELDAERRCELARHLGLADAGRAGEEIGADRLLAVAQTRAGELDRRGQRVDGLVLAVDDAFQRLGQMLEHFGIVLRHGLRRNPRHGRDRRLDLLEPIVFLRLFSGSSIWLAPVSSITSIALSGSLRSWM